MAAGKTFPLVIFNKLLPYTHYAYSTV